MMLVQHMSTPPEPPASTSSSSPPPRPPEPIRHFHGRINNEAPESVLQLNKSAWTSLQSTTSPLTTTISASTATTNTTTTTTTHPSLSSSQSSLPSTEITTTAKLATSPATDPSPPPFTIIPAKPHHAAQIRHIGSTVFANTFGFSIPPRDLSAYLTSSYSAASIQAELASPQHHFLVAVAARPQPEPRRTGSATAAERGCERGKADDDDDATRHETTTTTSTVIGFAQVTQHTTEPCLSHLAPESLIELQRLYVLPSHQNLGVGRALLAAAEEVARRVQFGATTTRTRTPKLTAARGELASRREQHRRRQAGEGTGMEWEWEWNEPDGVDESFDECEDEDEDEDEEDEEDEEDLVGVRVGSGMRPRLTSKPKPKRKINMWLGVWEGNFVAQNVYEKNGYERVGEHEFRMGRCVQIDWIMVKELEC